MANAIASQVQALYVGYLGRAADQAGLDFWTNAITAGTSTIESVALGFTLSQEYTSKYEGLSNEELAAAIYQNVLGRAADADGLAFWVGELEKGVQTPETLLAAMINSLGAVDQKVIDNKVYVANAYTAAAGADYKAEAGAKILEGVDGTAASVAKAIGTLPTSTATLTEGLEAINAAETAVANFLKTAGLDIDKDGDTTNTTPGDIDTNLTNALAAANAAGLDARYTAGGDAGLNASLVTLAKSEKAAALATEQKDLSNLQKIYADNADLKQAVSVYLSTTAAEVAAQKNAGVAAAGLAGAEAVFEAKQVDATIDNTYALVGGAIDPTSGGVTYDADNDGGTTAEVSLISWDATKKAFVVASGVVTAGTATGASDAAKALLADANDLLAAFTADYKAQVALNVAAANQDNSETALGVFDGYVAANDKSSVLTTGLGLAQAIASETQSVADAQKDIEALDNALASLDKALALSSEYKALEEKVTAAEKAVTDAGFALEVLDAATEAASGDSDVFLFGASTVNTTVSSFGLQGEDRIFFGEGFSLVELADDQAVSQNVGSSSALEIFMQQDGANTVLWVEKQAFAGSSTTSVSDLVQITLTGVAAEDISFDNGYLTVA